MEFLSFPLSSALLIILLFMLVKKAIQNKNSKLPPGPRKLPVIGSLHHLIGDGLPHHALRNLAKKHGPLMHLQLGENSTLVVSSSKMARAIMSTHDLMFANRTVQFATDILLYGGKGIGLAPYGDYWRQIRKICVLELLSAKRVQSFQTVREEEISNLIRSISAESSKVNFSEMITSLTNDIIARAAFGEKCKDKHAFLSLIEEGIQLAGGFDIAGLFPSLKLLHVITGKKRQLERVHNELDRILVDIIKENKEKRRASKLNEDKYEENLVDVLVRVQENTQLEVPLANDNLKAVILDIFVAGSETSSTTIEWAMSEMLKNPKVMKKAQAEVRRVFSGNKKINETEIQELSYLKLVLKETLRLHAPAPLLIPRECRESCEIDGYEIPKKTMVMVNAWAIGRDPENWSNGDRFEPERFDGISVDYKGTNFEYIPFGAGRRICPGMLFGMANVEVPLARLLYHFDWELPNGIKPEELDMDETFGTTVRRKNHLYLIPTVVHELERSTTKE
uniref:Desmethyl-deoxy-podophyllotoxin synthase n=1 Tax=Sinopodophyllum hexandrum TaxID=93608 RepID=C71BE_SINHE|nr:RecName: Full=Desmethyl-deoxy-podophyllotoxin synthase; AltName: Full=Cytochrome P450 family 71 subfamily BE polypeptide 54 [Sinopodophyllum hexandrum]ALG05141.1 cytochrome P450 family 71 subfamily BE polypeptide 54 [Sinopodophyllum hexandrum]